MTLLRYGLYIAVAFAVLATWQSTAAGYPIEVALLRGLIAFMASSLVAYFAELVIMTAPPVARPSARAHRGAVRDEDEYEASQPVSLPAIRAERDAAVDESRAA